MDINVGDLLISAPVSMATQGDEWWEVVRDVFLGSIMMNKTIA